MSTTKSSGNIQISESAANLGTSGRLGMAWPGPLALGNPQFESECPLNTSLEEAKQGMLKTNGVFPNIFQSVIKFLSFLVTGAEGKRIGAANPPGCALLCVELLFQEGMSRSGSSGSQSEPALTHQKLKTSQSENLQFKEQVKILNEWKLWIP